MWFDYGLGKGLKDGNNITCTIFGQPFGFSCPPGFGELTSDMEIVDPTTVFDLSSISPLHEVVTSLVRVHLDYQEQTPIINLTQQWYRQETDLSWTLVFTYNWGPVSYYCAGIGGCTTYIVYSYIGWCGWEINKNGNYKVVTTINGSPTNTTNFTITGIHFDTGTPGYIWIEDEDGSLGHIKYIGASGNIHQVTIHGSGSWSLTPGYLWIDGSEIIYTDAEGNYNGAKTIYSGPPNGAPGYLWIEGEELHFTKSDGIHMKCFNDY